MPEAMPVSSEKTVCKTNTRSPTGRIPRGLSTAANSVELSAMPSWLQSIRRIIFPLVRFFPQRAHHIYAHIYLARRSYCDTGRTRNNLRPGKITYIEFSGASPGSGTMNHSYLWPQLGLPDYKEEEVPHKSI